VQLSADQLSAYADRGFVRLDGFADRAICDAMLERVTDLVHRADRGEDVSPSFVMMEGQADFGGRPPEDRVAKIFRLARDRVFAEFAHHPDVVALTRQILGVEEVSCFLSQFIFKNPGAWGQPWHQDSYYFPFDPPRPVVGVWLAVTEATLTNGCLHVLPGSQHEPVHEHVPDRRPGALFGYVEIVDHDMAASEPVLMDPGDLLLFDSHLMHCSTDNEADRLRAAMVYHYAPTATIDRTEELKGYTINDWIPVGERSGVEIVAPVTRT
jgi:ectoine hydroxylase-related dioxygenase (phytanoyl-CoA dioxygenase family)